jgi:hypothetical protein
MVAVSWAPTESVTTTVTVYVSGVVSAETDTTPVMELMLMLSVFAAGETDAIA